jgi:4-aminobutyrate aminotransferase-like enzyme
MPAAAVVLSKDLVERLRGRPRASRVAARALEAGALIATSGEQTSLFLAPPLTVSDEEIDQILDALDDGLEVADAAL